MTYVTYGPARPRSDRGYLQMYMPGHVLASGGLIWMHRAVLFAKIGEGPHRCHWCATSLSWGRDLHTDHLDRDRSNNHPDNLVASCQSCNLARRYDGVRHGALYSSGCRCDECRAYNAASQRRWRERQAQLRRVA